MSSLWRRRRGGKSNRRDEINSGREVRVPTHFQCPISLELMKDPVSLATGITYDRESIDKWLDAGNVTCPVTNQVLRNSDQIPNHALRKMIQEWCVDNKSHGVERIPTPRVPINPYEVSDICSRMAAAVRGGDDRKCRELLTKIKNWAKESDRNRRCLVEKGIGAEMMEALARFSMEKHADLLKEMLSALTWSFPLGVSKLKSPATLRCMARFLMGDDLASRRDAILVLKELLINSDDGASVVEGLMGIEETLFQVVKVPICPRTTQACLVIIHHMMMVSDEKMRSRFVQLGLLALLLDILVDGHASKKACEKALAVLDEMCSSEQGKESAWGNALTIPILVKKILRVSDRATESCVSSLWKVCLGGNEEGLVEAVAVGAFQKLLVLLQLGCAAKTKEKASELLKFMNVYTNKVQCFDSSMGFKYVKSPA
ncbi:U-box domain-containing protein 21 [Salvia miltiorrhiza]|uniref:U-box domain-containing protein 21 n=1 Tax=Salvia miltiorrhiza TaxID=226208 RepID=UPI0025AC57A8|nr:U-box domain-containing protein 21 [Salvia miltiorrhiza]